MGLEHDTEVRGFETGLKQDVKGCDHPDCDGVGQYRAPKAPNRLNEHYWFCLEHVREYNAAWNYCEGLSDDEVEARVRADTVWHRPTWPMGLRRGLSEEMLHAEAMAFASMGKPKTHEKKQRFDADDPGPGKDARERRALAALNLKRPVTFVEIRSRYIDLVKRLHPDTNGGDRSAEDRLKTINRAYALLRERFG